MPLIPVPRSGIGARYGASTTPSSYGRTTRPRSDLFLSRH
jgi:hypothetical protein